MFPERCLCSTRNAATTSDRNRCGARDMLLEFYAASGDFTRRLTSVKANSKFSAPDAGPEDYFSVRSKHPAASNAVYCSQ